VRHGFRTDDEQSAPNASAAHLPRGAEGEGGERVSRHYVSLYLGPLALEEVGLVVDALSTSTVGFALDGAGKTFSLSVGTLDEEEEE
jgi:hypothetical protein